MNELEEKKELSVEEETLILSALAVEEMDEEEIIPEALLLDL